MEEDEVVEKRRDLLLLVVAGVTCSQEREVDKEGGANPWTDDKSSGDTIRVPSKVPSATESLGMVSGRWFDFSKDSSPFCCA